MPAEREDWFEAEKLIRAAQEGEVAEMVRLVAAGYDVDVMDVISKGALHYAIENEHDKAAKWLVEHGATVDLHHDAMAGDTPLNVAARGACPGIAELLLRQGADPDVPGWMRITARMRARERTDSAGKAIAALIELYKPARRPAEA